MKQECICGEPGCFRLLSLPAHHAAYTGKGSRKKKFFLVARPLPSPLSVAGTLKIRTFFAASLKEYHLSSSSSSLSLSFLFYISIFLTLYYSIYLSIFLSLIQSFSLSLINALSLTLYLLSLPHFFIVSLHGTYIRW